jgi:predicted transcriptional regulator
MTPGRRKKRCPDLIVRMRILQELHENGEHHPTNLAGSSNVSYTMLKTCLFSLQRHGLVTITRMDDGHDIVKITDAGIEILDLYQRYFSKLMED